MNFTETIEIRDRRNGNWFWVDNALYEQYAKVLGASAVLVYIAICRHADGRQEAYPGEDRIAERTGLGRRTIVRAIEILVRHGLIIRNRKREGRGRWGRNSYTLLDQRYWKTTPSAKMAPGYADSYIQGSMGAESVEKSKDHAPRPSAKKSIDQVPPWHTNKTQKNKIYNNGRTYKVNTGPIRIRELLRERI